MKTFLYYPLIFSTYLLPGREYRKALHRWHHSILVASLRKATRLCLFLASLPRRAARQGWCHLQSCQWIYRHTDAEVLSSFLPSAQHRQKLASSMVLGQWPEELPWSPWSRPPSTGQPLLRPSQKHFQQGSQGLAAPVFAPNWGWPGISGGSAADLVKKII